MKGLIDKLEKFHTLSREEFIEVLSCDEDYLFERAGAAARKIYGNKIYLRGLIEFSNFCKNGCYYCGIRAGNKNAQRYRLSKEQILECCKTGYPLGLRTFVLQSGEDDYYTDNLLAEIIKGIKSDFSDCAVTLSVGERSYASYEKLFKAGADRYLLRHETANNEHYAFLHPSSMSSANRKKCLYDLKKIGYQVGCGIIAGSPGQTTDHIMEDLLFIKELKPHMAGIGPFIPHSDTPFKDQKPGDLRLTLNIIAILRLMQPDLLIPATTALGTIDVHGRELGILAGANVVMPNLSPVEARKKYLLYDNKISAGEETAEGINGLRKRIKMTGYEVEVSRGDWKAG